MGVVRQVCDRVNVMYLGRIVEQGRTDEVFEEPQHPYTEALMASIPQPDPRARGSRVRLTGDVPSPSNPPSGCRFHTRCPKVIPPEAFDLERSVWRSVMDLRGRLERGLDTAAVLESHGDNEGEATADVVDHAVREEFGLPDDLGDAAATRAVDESIRFVADGEQARARERLAEAFPTPCEDHDPPLVETSPGHTSACLRHEAVREAVAGEVRDVAGGPTRPSTED
jgi:peptide/nickel transport system ATP-binding protein